MGSVWIIIAGLLSVVPVVLALPRSHDYKLSKLRWTPGISLSGLVGDELNSDAKLSTMLPFSCYEDFFCYGSLVGQYASTQDWLVGLGLGSRYLLNTRQFIGAYLFVDRLTSARKNAFWFANIGMELVSSTTDVEKTSWLSAQVNTYLPVGRTSYPLGEMLGRTVTDTYYRTRVDSNIYYDQSEMTGFGLDARLAYHLGDFNNAIIELSPYFFNYPRRVLYGASVALKAPLNRQFAILLRGSFDNIQPYAVMAGFCLSFGSGVGGSAQPKSMTTQLLEPAARYTAPLSRMSTLVLVGQQAMQTLQERLNELKQQHPQHVQRIYELEQEIAGLTKQKTEIVEQLESEIQTKKSKIADQKGEIEAQQSTIVGYTNQLRDRFDQLIARNNLIQQLGPLDTTLDQGLTRQISTIDNRIRSLQETENTLKEELELYSYIEANMANNNMFRVDFNSQRSGFERYAPYQALRARRPNHPIIQLFNDSDSEFIRGNNLSDRITRLRAYSREQQAVLRPHLTQSEQSRQLLETQRQNLRDLQNQRSPVQSLLSLANK